MNPFEKTFDELFNAILTDFKNQFPEADSSKGSLIFIRSAALASSLWGLYKYQGWIARQAFPDTADVEALEHHAWVRGINRRTGESDADLLARLLDYIRRPPAGGNKYDYVKWALSITNVKSAYCIPLAQGPGSVDLVIVADISTGSEVPSADLIAEVRAYVEDQRPVTAKYLRVLAPEILPQDVIMTGSGPNYNAVQAALDVASYLSGFAPGQPLYRSQLGNIAILNGAEDYVVASPAVNVVPATMQTIRPGAINVT
ncbi:hypothetical protein GMLC_14520 [Geomonas limicola]|uniref:Baseplate J-like central domain-containing protein n=1 Tax=Geomonas limicola TaxID=2740186 RepID=A0A6V8N8N3_9BACT|nr:baseplate J/gp47 family protein [Geomonas limicola]GFO67873.1 hypothetical protein GMLC_14520 [Geomonas limicola]